MIKKALKTIFPSGSRGFIVLKRMAIMLNLTSELPVHELNYSEWTERAETFYYWKPYKALKYSPLISVVVPVFNTPPKHFLPMVYSLVNQTYENWQLILVNASTNNKGRQMTVDAASIDKRIKIVDVEGNLGIARNTDAGLKRTEGEYIGFLDHDDVLAPQALFEVASLLQDKRKPELIYSDEDKLTNNGQHRVDPHFKPDWSPQLLRFLNYINHFAVVHKKLLDEIGGFRTGFDGAQDYDLFLRAVDKTNKIAHIPRILYHWRTARTSTSENFSQKDNVLNAGVKALEDHLKRNNQSGSVTPIKDKPGFYKIDYKYDHDKKLTILILPSIFHGEYRKFLFNFIESIHKTKFKVDVIAQKPMTPIKNVFSNVNIKYIDENNKDKFLHLAADMIDTELTLIVGSGVYPINKSWLSSIAGLMSEVDDIAIVAPLIMAGDRETIIDAGYVRSDKALVSIFQGYPEDQHTCFGNSDWARNIDAVGNKCFMIRSDILKSNTDKIKIEHNFLFDDSMYNLLLENNKQIVSWPFSRMVYVGTMDSPNLKTRYFNPNLDVSKTEFCTIEVIHSSRNYKDE